MIQRKEPFERKIGLILKQTDIKVPNQVYYIFLIYVF